MREIVTINVGNNACYRNASFWNDFKNVTNADDYNRTKLFYESDPRVIFIDYIGGFLEKEHLDEEISELKKNTNIEIIENAYPQSSIGKNWKSGYYFKQKLSNENAIKLKTMTNETQENNSEASVFLGKLLAHDELMKINNFGESFQEATRRNIERCHSLDGFQLTIDQNIEFLLMIPEILNSIHDDYGKKSILGFSFEETNFENRLSNAVYNVAKMFHTLSYYENENNIYIPIQNYDRSYNRLFDGTNRLWTNRDSVDSELLSMSTLISSLTDLPFGHNCKGAIGSAIFETNEKVMNDLFSTWSQYTDGLDNFFQESHQNIQYKNVYSQHYIVQNLKDVNFKTFSNMIQTFKWKDALNLHIPSSQISTKDVLEACLYYNYYGAKNYCHLYPSEKGNGVISVLYNTESIYSYLQDQYALCSQASTRIKKLLGSKASDLYCNGDYIDESLSSLCSLLDKRNDEDFSYD